MLKDSTGQVSEDGGPSRHVSGCVRKRQEADEDFTVETPLTLIESLFLRLFCRNKSSFFLATSTETANNDVSSHIAIECLEQQMLPSSPMSIAKTLLLLSGCTSKKS